MEKEELWQATLAKIELSLSHASFQAWFQETEIADIKEGAALISVPNGFAKEWLQNKYHKTILHSLREVIPEIKDISFVVGKSAAKYSQHHPRPVFSKQKRPSGFSSMNDDLMTLKDLSVNPDTNLNPRYTFDTFVVGSFNEMAHAASQSVIKNLGTSYNPFFIYGGVGLGKTHLIQAIGNECLKLYPGLKVKYISSEKYMTEVVDALKNQEMNALKNKYRAVDLLIMDDVQFMARTEKMQEEFFHTFNSLFERNKQIIISSDRPPQAIPTLEERLRSRFEGGLTADVSTPDYETRILILKTKATNKSFIIPNEVIEYIAETIKTNIRELEGALNRIIMNSKLTNAPITREMAQKSLLSHLNAPKKFISAKKIIKAISDFYGIDESDLLQHSRKKDLVRPRQIAMYLMREELKSSYPSIGDRFSGRDHTTAIHAYVKVCQDLKNNADLEAEIQAIKYKIFSN